MFDAKNTLFATVFSYYSIFSLFSLFNNKKVRPEKAKAKYARLNAFYLFRASFHNQSSVSWCLCVQSSITRNEYGGSCTLKVLPDILPQVPLSMFTRSCPGFPLKPSNGRSEAMSMPDTLSDTLTGSTFTSFRYPLPVFESLTTVADTRRAASSDMPLSLVLK